MYVATINQPGYLPDSDTPPPTFDTKQESWEYLLGEFQFHNEYTPDTWPTEDLGSYVAEDGFAYSVMVAEED